MSEFYLLDENDIYIELAKKEDLADLSITSDDYLTDAELEQILGDIPSNEA